ncbi:Pectate lyase superfamily protein [compost metagenome]
MSSLIEGEVLPGGISKTIQGITTNTRAHPDDVNPILKQLLDNGVTLASVLDESLGRAATVVVAASNSSDKTKSSADYVCTGTDDQITINNAISELPVEGGKVLLMEGAYTVSNGIMQPNGVTLEGMGMSTIIRLRDLQSTNVSIIQNADTLNGNINIEVRNLLIDGNKANAISGVMYGVYYAFVSFGKIENVRVLNMRSSGIHITNNSSDNIVIGNYCKANKDSGILISSNSGNNTFMSNNCRDNSSNGIFNNSSDNTIIGNTCSGNSTGISNSGSNNTIIGNNCSNNFGAGISISNGSYNNVQNNTVRKGSESPTYGIRVNAGSTKNLVTNNDLYESGATAFSDAGTGTITTAGNRLT